MGAKGSGRRDSVERPSSFSIFLLPLAYSSTGIPEPVASVSPQGSAWPVLAVPLSRLVFQEAHSPFTVTAALTEHGSPGSQQGVEPLRPWRSLEAGPAMNQPYRHIQDTVCSVQKNAEKHHREVVPINKDGLADRGEGLVTECY